MPALTITAVISVVTGVIVAVVTAFLTYLLTKRREHEADWRKLKFGQYQEFVLALSEVTQGGRPTSMSLIRYANAINSMSLVAPIEVLRAIREFQDAVSIDNKIRPDGRLQELISLVFKALRKDVQPGRHHDASDYKFTLRASPSLVVEPNEVS
jgi:hypothetical protein